MELPLVIKMTLKKSLTLFHVLFHVTYRRTPINGYQTFGTKSWLQLFKILPVCMGSSDRNSHEGLRVLQWGVRYCMRTEQSTVQRTGIMHVRWECLMGQMAMQEALSYTSEQMKYRNEVKKGVGGHSPSFAEHT